MKRQPIALLVGAGIFLAACDPSGGSAQPTSTSSVTTTAAEPDTGGDHAENISEGVVCGLWSKPTTVQVAVLASKDPQHVVVTEIAYPSDDEGKPTPLDLRLGNIVSFQSLDGMADTYELSGPTDNGLRLEDCADALEPVETDATAGVNGQSLLLCQIRFQEGRVVVGTLTGYYVVDVDNARNLEIGSSMSFVRDPSGDFLNPAGTPVRGSTSEC